MQNLFKVLKYIFGLVLILVIIALLNAVRVDSYQIKTGSIELSSVSDKALIGLSKALTLKTVAGVGMDSTQFDTLSILIDRQYPNVHAKLELAKINTYSRLYFWQGKNPNLKPILLMGHTDVVPVAESTLANWEEGPWSGTISEGTLWGRGTLDDKANIFALLEAVESLVGMDYEPQRGLYLAFGHDEEVGGKDGAVAIVDHLKKLGVSLEFVLDEGSIIIDKALDGLESPLAMIGITEKGYTTLTLAVILSEGGHSSMPQGETAIGMLSKAISKLENYPFKLKIDGATKLFFEYIAPEADWIRRIIFSNLWLTGGIIKWQLAKDNTSAALLRTTTAPTMLRGGIKENILPSRASAKVNFRILPGETVGSVISHVKNVIDDNRVIVMDGNKQFSSDPSPISPVESLGFKTIQRTVSEVFPEAIVAPSLVIAATDSRHFVDLTGQIYRFSPLILSRKELKGIHGVNEKIKVVDYKKMILFYEQLVMNSTK